MPFLIAILVLFTSTLWAKTPLKLEKVCAGETCYQTPLGKPLPVKDGARMLAAYSLSTDLTNEECHRTNNCYLFLGAVGDAAKVTINGHPLIDNTRAANNFSFQDSTRFALPAEFLSDGENTLSVEVQDLNGTLFGLLDTEPFVGSEFETYKAQVVDWFLRTGITLFSAYTLIVFALTILLLLLIRFELSILAVFAYCVVACLYLISFSEYPRKFFEPEMFSGTVHFFLRLSQDLCLFTTFHLILNVNRHYNRFFKTFVGVYALFILSFPIVYLLGYTTYATAKQIIYVGAPLVALPMGYAFILATRLPRGFERNLLLPITFVLFVFQVHDLFLFWQLIPSYFMVKFYVPAVVSLLLYIQVRRYVEDYSEKNRMAEKVIFAKQVIHDIKSPVGVLGIVIAKAELNNDLKELADLAFERMHNLVKNLRFESLSPNEVLTVKLAETINKIIREKTIEYSDIAAHFEFKCEHEVTVTANAYDLSRILSNVINNAIEASQKNPMIKVSIHESRNEIELHVTDSGKGIPADILSSIGRFGFSFGKKDSVQSSGLGLYSAKKTMRSWGGDIKIRSQQNAGTTVILIFPKNFVAKPTSRLAGLNEI